ncbi:hypothetical protein MHBO_003863 [Bonamia ostreae]|uniref:TOG domain-containing protein n=1 Tax=Bonamia ostreae TaxID=126728 RepID=A0ABV2ASK6_9EUKA
MLKVVEDVVKLNDESSLIEVFEDLIDMVNLNPKSIRLYFEQFVKLMSDAAMATNMSKEVRILALEFLVVLAEMDNGVYRRSELYVRRAFMSALVMMLEISDPPNWINDLDDESEEENEIYSEGEVAMDRLSQAFGSARVLKIAIPLIGKFLSHEDWKRRVAGLIAISQMAESVDNEHAEKFVRTVSAFYKDQNPRVVFSAIHCIGQMCEDFAPQIQKQLHGLVLPPLVEILKNSKIVKF